VPYFAPIGQAVAEIWLFLHFSRWICYTPVWTTHEEYLVVFATAQNLVGIGGVVSIICKFYYILSVRLENAYSRPFWCFGVKIGEIGNLLQFHPSRNAITRY